MGQSHRENHSKGQQTFGFYERKSKAVRDESESTGVPGFGEPTLENAYYAVWDPHS